MGKITKDKDVGYNPLENRDRQHSREDWYKEAGEKNLLLQYIECSHTDADIFETWLINYYCTTGQLVNKAKTYWGKSSLDMSLAIFGKWRNFGQSTGDIEEKIRADVASIVNIFLKETDHLDYNIEPAIDQMNAEIRRIRDRLLKCRRISRYDMQDDFKRREGA